MDSTRLASKPLSGGNIVARRRDLEAGPEVSFFVDRCLGRGDGPTALRAAGAIVHTHDDHFDQRCPDEEWIRVVTDNGWAIPTKDKRIQRRRSELSALVHSVKRGERRAGLRR